MAKSEQDFRETLYTITSDGSRKWVYPTVKAGRFRKLRTLVAWLLVAIYLALPWIIIGDEQAVRLDLVNRKFIFLGHIFWATDSYFLVMVLGALAVGLFFFTALAGRVWCGWACPETVFLEFIFRPLESLIEGTPAERLRLDMAPWTWKKVTKKGFKYLCFGFISWLLASTGVALFVGRGEYLAMMQGSPFANWVPFTVMLFFMALCLFQFGWFREQFCTVLCPYARFQSVLLDSQSLVVGYDSIRGEPRGKLRAAERDAGNRDTGDRGDCIDCGLCVRVCPTGIDIRNGLQLECIHCAACVDACDSIMESIGKPKGLVRYDTEAGLQGSASRLLRPRVVIYGLVILVYVGALLYFLGVRSLSEFQVVRGAVDAPFVVLEDGRVSNHLHVNISNKAKEKRLYRVVRVIPEDLEVLAPLSPFPVAPETKAEMPLFVNFDKKLLVGGKLQVELVLGDDLGWEAEQRFTLLGPD